MKLEAVIVIILACVGCSVQQQSGCQDDPCLNGATCYAGGGGRYYCACPAGFDGDTCENYNVCSNERVVTCLNGGSCVSDSTISQGYRCHCTSNYEGDQCQTLKLRNVCASDSITCLNGGTCVNNATNTQGYSCECPVQYEGALCQTIRVNVCRAQTPCQNGGTCLLSSDLSLGYLCQCPPQFEGINCQTMQTAGVCTSDTCKNGGTCFRASSRDSDPNTQQAYLCVCRPGYTGQQCENVIGASVDVCESMQPCLNNGTCFTSSNDDLRYICMCPQYFSGSRCEIMSSDVPDLCLSDNPCLNNSTCVHLMGATSVTCQCAHGYVGEYCGRLDTGSGACLPNPCSNGGTCNSDPFAAIGYTCSCLPTFSGVNCEAEYMGCSSNPCQNSGTCVVQTYGTYFCQCPEGYVGRLCEDTGPCASSPCVNGGICMENPQILNYNCICPDGFMGTHCEQSASADPCDPNPCGEGICYKSGGTAGVLFICVCPSYTVGDLCSPDPCLSQPCRNGGSCNPIFNPSTRELVAVGCVCPTGFTGPTCAVVGPCQSNPCQNGGTCIDSTGSSPDPLMDWSVVQPAMLAFFCMCPPEWAGTTCSESDPCVSNPCENNGECQRIEGGFTCVCQGLYTGQQCETRVTPCDPNPCMNSGRCEVSGETLYTCVCPQPWVGTHCERSDPCASSPCLNNGTCFRSWRNEQFICQCPVNIRGTNCQDINPCLSEPCLNGGYCNAIFDPTTNERVAFQCDCPTGFMGSTCAEVVNNCASAPCLNGGICYNGGANGFVCLCSAAYTGTFCQEPLPTTTTLSSTTVRTTQPAPVACNPNPCKNQGTCLPIGSGPFSFTCLCAVDFAGLTCMVHLEPYSPCESNPCQNGGTCKLHTGLGTGSGRDVGFLCVCGNGFIGNTCALFIESPDPNATTASVSTPTSTTLQTTTLNPLIPDSTQIIRQDESTTAERLPPGPQSCSHDGSDYEEGAMRAKDCVKCTCINGQWLCGERNCDCMINGVRYRNSDTWSVECNTCICNGGVDICTDMTCGTACFQSGTYYPSGVTRQSECNSCVCEEGNWICTDEPCDDTCLFGGETYFVGEMRKESCNSCFCLKDAQWLCTVRDCKGSPIIINVFFKINQEFYIIENSQQRFITDFKEDMRQRYNLAKQNIQNVMVFPGSIDVMFDLVEVKDSNVDVQATASDLGMKIQDRTYMFRYDGLDLFADPSSFKQERLVMEGGNEPQNNGIGGLEQSTIILIAVVGCGTLGLIIVIASVCYFTRHAPRRARTEYGDSRLPRTSDRAGNTTDGFVNIAYQNSLPDIHRNGTE